MHEIALRRLKELREEADRITYAWSDSGQFRAWELNVETALVKLFGETSTCLKNLRAIWWTPGVTYSDTPDEEWERAFMRGLDEAKGVLDAAIRTAEDYGAKPSTPSAVVEDVASRQQDGSVTMDPSKLTLGQLAKTLTTGQAWGLILTLAALVGGAFTLGVKMTDYRRDRAESRLSETTDELAALSKKLQQAGIKEQYLSAYTRYLAAREQLRNSYTPEAVAKSLANERAFAQLINGWMQKVKDSPGAPRVEFTPVIHKGEDIQNSHVEFADGTLWAVPGEVKQIVLQIQNPVRLP